MKAFMDQDFLLSNETAKQLYHDYAKDCPIYDYHCHLSPKEIAENKSYDTITQVWLGGDHYKWRAMRSFGIPETLITGDGDDFEKFMAFAKMVPYTIGNPLYHWTHLELQRFFGIDTLLDETSARDIYDRCNALLQQEAFSARGLIQKSKVEVICTTDDPIDDLVYHKAIKTIEGFDTKVLPTFRPDKGVNIHLETFLPWLKALESAVGHAIKDMTTLLDALTQRVTYFHEVGGRLADHGLDEVDYGSPYVVGTQSVDMTGADQVLQKALVGASLSAKEITLYKSVVTHHLGQAYAEKGWVMQLHIGALRNNNRRMHALLGPDTGFDSIHDSIFAKNLSALLNDLDSTDALPKTIIYVLNARDNDVIGTMIGNFQGGGTKGKIQFGSGWWFNDQKDGMIAQMKALANLGLLSQFVGMLTDSRSFLSYTRHEYFRRILCNVIGEWVENGEYPNHTAFLGKMVQDISIDNARNYFKC